MDVTWCDQKFHHVWLFLAAILTPKNRSLRTESETVKTCLTEFSRSYFRICVLSLLDRVVLILVDWTTICVGKHKGTQMGWFTTRPLVWSPAINDLWPTQISPCLSFGLRLVKSDRFFDWNPIDDHLFGESEESKWDFWWIPPCFRWKRLDSSPGKLQNRAALFNHPFWMFGFSIN